ncbi:MAG: NAD(P)/FAD-dependent oxidoreductase, partial [Clostridium perfringens]|nr:NAD(P)/FAD-dependent oxidoreductase [Clostridium perfringens]
LNKDFKNSLDELLPKKLIPVIIELSGIDENKKVNSITKEERRTLLNLLKNLTFTVKGLRDIAEAIVTAGGVSTKEIDPSTMQSKIVDNLYFAGEVIDVDAFTGGYNVQIALSTGYLAGKSI